MTYNLLNKPPLPPPIINVGISQRQNLYNLVSFFRQFSMSNFSCNNLFIHYLFHSLLKLINNYELFLVPLPRGRSHVWEQFGFKVDNNSIMLNKKQIHCHVCKSVTIIAYSGNTTNLKSCTNYIIYNQWYYLIFMKNGGINNNTFSCFVYSLIILMSLVIRYQFQ